MDGVANELLLIALITQQHIVIGKALYAFQLYDLEHTHIDVGQAVFSHKFLYFDHHRRVRLIDLNGHLSAFHSYKAWRPLIHSCNQSETRLINRPAGRIELRVHKEMLSDSHETMFRICGDTAARLINGCGRACAIEHGQELGTDKCVMIHAGDCACRTVDRYVLILRGAAELLGEKCDLGHAEAILNGYCRAWLINGRRHILSSLAHAVELDHKCVATIGYKLYKSGINAFERVLGQRLFPCEN